LERFAFVPSVAIISVVSALFSHVGIVSFEMVSLAKGGGGVELAL